MLLFVFKAYATNREGHQLLLNLNHIGAYSFRFNNNFFDQNIQKVSGS